MSMNIQREIGKVTRQQGLQGMKSDTEIHDKYAIVAFADGTEFAVGKVPATIRSRSIENSRTWARLS